MAWRKMGYNTWENTSGNHVFWTWVQVSQKPPLYEKKNWRVQISSNKWGGLIARHGLYKKDALKFAKEWMKSNPNG